MVNWQFIMALLIPSIGGWASAISMIGQVKRPGTASWYRLLDKPAWTPPDWLFAPVWVFLYTAMGCASYIVYQESGGFIDAFAYYPLSLYVAQLAMNWAWTPIFFGLHWIGFALLDMLLLDVVTIACTISFYETEALAGHLMLPYLGWLAFATCLNYSIWIRNS